MTDPRQAVDVVVVAYNSRGVLRDCVAPLADRHNVIVVDNASPDDSAAAVADLPVRVIRAPRNGGFSYGCNLGIAAGEADLVLLLNPDARMDVESIDALVARLQADPRVAGAGPRLLEDDGGLAWSQRRFPRLRSTFSQALFLQRLAPLATWSDEVIRDPAQYERPGAPDWLSGACLLLRRSALETVGPMDEGFFLYSEEIDLFRRFAGAGFTAALRAAGHRTPRGWRVRAAQHDEAPLGAESRALRPQAPRPARRGARGARGRARGADAQRRLDSPAGERSRPRRRGARGARRPAFDAQDRMKMLSYAIVTPARNERDNLARLAQSVIAQDLRPARWVIVDDGSDDGMYEVAQALAAEHDWITVAGTGEAAADLAEGRRRGRDLLAFRRGLKTLPDPVDVFVKVDADTSFEADYFAQLMQRFADGARPRDRRRLLL